MLQYLNLENRWPRLRRFGLEVDAETGALTLRRLPGPPVGIGCMPGEPTTASQASGLAVGPDGTVFLSTPADPRVYRLDPLSSAAVPLGSFQSAAEGTHLGQAKSPQGLAFQTCRNRLLIADTGNHRIQVVDPVSEQVTAVWGQSVPSSQPRPCWAEGGLDGPEQLACDRDANVYVIDRSADERRVTKLTPDGIRSDDFTRRVRDVLRQAPGARGTGGQIAPRLVACGLVPTPDGPAQREIVYVLGTQEAAGRSDGKRIVRLYLFVLEPTGRPLLSKPLLLLGGTATTDTHAAKSVIGPLLLGPPPAGPGKIAPDPGDTLRGSAVMGTMLFVGIAAPPAVGPCSSKDRDRVWCFELGTALQAYDPAAVEPSWLPLYEGPVAALSVSGTGANAELLIQGGPGQHVVALRQRGNYRTQGAFLAGPLTGLEGQLTPWHRLRLIGELPPGCRAQLFTLSRNEGKFGFSPPVRPQLDRLPGWFRLEAYADQLQALGFAQATEVVPIPQPEAVVALQWPGDATPESEPDLAAPNAWFAAPDGQIDVMTRNSGGTSREPADQLWILGLLAGDGHSSPHFMQAQLGYDEDGWLADLPSYYQRTPRARSFMRGLSAFLQSAFDDVLGGIDRLPALFSPSVLWELYGRGSPELSWLSTSLALPLPGQNADWKRVEQVFRDGPYWLALRGTPEGFRRLVWLETGRTVHIDEPALWYAPQALGTGGTWTDLVGYTELPLTPGATPALSADLAFHFVVRGYAVDLDDPDARAALERAVRRYAPAHATYSLQVIEPRMRVELQARLGIDTVVAADEPIDPLRLGVPPGPDTQISPEPAPPPTVGSAHLGSETTLS